MSDAANAALAELGLSAATFAPEGKSGGAGKSKPEAAPVAPVEPAAETTTEATDEASFEIGDSEEFFVSAVPATARAFAATATKYGFENIAAPAVNEDGSPKFAAKLIKFVGGDKDKFKRSVQSGATSQNKKAREAGAPNYYETRTHEVGGEFVGMVIYRTDNRPDDTAAAAE
jgi:hypothetical protein